MSAPQAAAKPAQPGEQAPLGEVVLQTRSLSKHFGGIQATQNVSLDLTRGARHALIGPNGAGKTTLVNLLTGVLTPSAGQVFLMGQDISALPAHQRVGLGLVRTFQISQLFDSLTPRQSLSLAVAARHKEAGRWWQALGSARAQTQRTDELLAHFRLAQHAEQATRQLPYGKRRLLEMALALALEPKVLLLDEPAAGVPAAERQDILDTVAALPTDVSVLLIEHDMDLVFSFAQRITVLVNGAVLTEGTPQAIASDPRVKAVYLGEGDAHGSHGSHGSHSAHERAGALEPVER